MDSILELKGITRRFGGLVANKDVSFDVARGEILGLIGPNGAGKSTLFNQIAGLYQPTSGRIIFNGADITNRNATDRCGLGIARTFQVVRSFDQMSVLSNVLVGALVRNRRTADARLAAYKVLEFAGLADRADVLASDLTSPEKRRLEFARALATEPKLLLLDEVLTGLTPTEAKAGVELIRRIVAELGMDTKMRFTVDLIQARGLARVVRRRWAPFADSVQTCWKSTRIASSH